MHIGVCEYCGKKTEYKYKSWIKRYCSHDCANKASANTRKKDRANLYKQLVNEIFGEDEGK